MTPNRQVTLLFMTCIEEKMLSAAYQFSSLPHYVEFGFAILHAIKHSCTHTQAHLNIPKHYPGRIAR
jgi:hypothetical protein